MVRDNGHNGCQKRLSEEEKDRVKIRKRDRIYTNIPENREQGGLQTR
jgi:hypothetical protein